MVASTRDNPQTAALDLHNQMCCCVESGFGLDRMRVDCIINCCGVSNDAVVASVNKNFGEVVAEKTKFLADFKRS